MVITGAIWAGFSMLLSKQLVAWCLVVACPAMCPIPRMALTLPDHIIEGKTSTGLGTAQPCTPQSCPGTSKLPISHGLCSSMYHRYGLCRPTSPRSPMPPELYVCGKMVLSVVKRVPSMAGTALASVTVLPVFPACGSFRASFLLPPDPATVGFKAIRKVAWRRLCKMPVGNYGKGNHDGGENGVRRTQAPWTPV